jgi:GAF domain-containing protein
MSQDLTADPVVTTSSRHDGSTTHAVHVELQGPDTLGAVVHRRVPDPDSDSSGHLPLPRLYLTTTGHCAPHPFEFSREHWEVFKRLGDLAWAEWDRARLVETAGVFCQGRQKP